MTQSLERRGAAIDVTGLRKEYLSGPARVVALDDINLRIAPGEFLCIVGPSGCGKSTLLRILAGLTAPSGGTINVASMLDMQAWFHKSKMSNSEFPADRLVDKSYVDYAVSKLPPFVLENKESKLAGCR